MTDRRAILAVLLDATGLSQSEAARLIAVEDRTLRRWLEGQRAVPADVIERLTALSDALDRAASEAVKMIDEADGPVALLLYRRDEDVPDWAGLPSASVHRSMMRRVFEQRRDRVLLVMFDAAQYRAWLGRRQDNTQHRAAWAALQTGNFR